MSTRSFAVIALLCALFVIAGPALAGEIEGKIQSVNPADRTITLDNGATLVLGDGLSADGLKEGDQVKVSFDERDGKQVVTSVDPKYAVLTRPSGRSAGRARNPRRTSDRGLTAVTPHG